MSPEVAGKVKRYGALTPERLAQCIDEAEYLITNTQTDLAAMLKAQKNQKRAAKDRKKVVG